MNNSIENDQKYLLQRLNSIYVPYYVRFFEKFSINLNILYVILGLIPFFGLLILSIIINEPLDFTTVWIFLFISAIIIAGYTLLGYAYSNTCNSLEETIKLLKNKKQIVEFEHYIKIMFKSNYQITTCILVVLLGFSVVLLMDISLIDPFKIYLIIISILAFSSAGPGLWLAITSAYFISQLKNIGPLKLNTVHPNETLGIKKLSRLLAIFSISFSFELFLFLVVYFLAPWNNLEIKNLFTDILVVPFILFMLFYFIYPQFGINSIIIDHKEKNIMSLENKISEIYNKDVLTVDDLNLIKGYNDLYTEVRESSNNAIDFTIAFKFISSMTFPLIIILNENPKIITYIFNLLK